MDAEFRKRSPRDDEKDETVIRREFVVQNTEQHRHAVVIPLFGAGSGSEELAVYCGQLVAQRLMVVLVDNNPNADSEDMSRIPCSQLLRNNNKGCIAGGLNLGVDWAWQAGASWITMMDQDSRILPNEIQLLHTPLEQSPERRLVVGPSIWDARKGCRHGSWSTEEEGLDTTRLLISSGTTFRSRDWQELGRLHEGLCIDFVDYAWCFKAQAKGFKLVQLRCVKLHQRFGSEHHNPLCKLLGMRLYNHERHYYALRNLRWLCRQTYVPFSVKTKESLKMIIRIWGWLLLEHNRRANLLAIYNALTSPLPGPD